MTDVSESSRLCHLRDSVRRFRIWRRRRKLYRGYSKVAEAELGKSAGFTPIMRTWEHLEREGYVEIEEGELRWLWP